MAGGDISMPSRVVCTVAGTALVAGGASAFNQVIERSPDSLMRRTRLRPVPDGRLQPFESLVFATALVARGPVDPRGRRQSARARSSRSRRSLTYAAGLHAAQAPLVVRDGRRRHSRARCRR